MYVIILAGQAMLFPVTATGTHRWRPGRLVRGHGPEANPIEAEIRELCVYAQYDSAQRFKPYHLFVQ